MATTTTNYGLKKPSGNDDADISVINENMDIIDAKMKEIEDAGGSGAYTWADVASKPFETVGSGLNVDESGALNVTGGGSGGSSVEWKQITTSGTKIAEVTIDGSKTDVYAPNGGGGSGSSALVIPDYSNLITTVNGTTYTATQNCYVEVYVEASDGREDKYEVNGVMIGRCGVSSGIYQGTKGIFLKESDVLKTRQDVSHTIVMRVFGLQSISV